MLLRLALLLIPLSCYFWTAWLNFDKEKHGTLSCFRYIDMAESLCQKRALEAFRLDPAKWGGKYVLLLYGNEPPANFSFLAFVFFLLFVGGC